jgi:hypothetical protein
LAFQTVENHPGRAGIGNERGSFPGKELKPRPGNGPQEGKEKGEQERGRFPDGELPILATEDREVFVPVVVVSAWYRPGGFLDPFA